jgi:hypothetical protein
MSVRPPQAPSALKQIWLKWKTLRLPWRRQFLAGSDLSGNTFWEFKDAMNANRYRRIVRYAKAGHYSDVKVSGKCYMRFNKAIVFTTKMLTIGFPLKQRNGINGYDTRATNRLRYKNRLLTWRGESA